MHGFISRPDINAQQLKNTLSIIEASCSYDMYNMPIAPNHWSTDKGSTTAPSFIEGSAGSYAPHWLFDPATEGLLSVLIRRHKEWRDGLLALRVLWSTDGTDNSDVDFCWDAQLLALGENVPAKNLDTSPVAPIGVAAYELNLKLPEIDEDYRRINAATDAINVIFGRASTDSNPDKLVVYSVELIYIESVKLVGSKSQILPTTVK